MEPGEGRGGVGGGGGGGEREEAGSWKDKEGEEDLHSLRLVQPVQLHARQGVLAQSARP